MISWRNDLRRQRKRQRRELCTRPSQIRLEQLEARWVLSAPTVVSTVPAANDQTADINLEISAIFDQPIDPASISTDSVVVHGQRMGSLIGSAATVNVDQQVAAFISPAQPFRAGELVTVTVTENVTSGAKEPAVPYLWQFRTAAGRGDGRGTGFFADSAQRLRGAVSNYVALGDLDGDGDLDSLAYAYSSAAAIWLNDGSGRFRNSGRTVGVRGMRSITLGDIDGDGDLDVLTSGSDANTIWLNDGEASFVESDQRIGGPDRANNVSTLNIALGDLDADGDLDAFVGNSGQQLVINDGHPFMARTGHDTVWLNDGRGHFQNSGQQLGDSFSRNVSLGDLDGDGDLDAMVGDAYGGDVTAWQNDGQGNFQRHPLTETSDARLVVLGDLDADGDLDAFLGGSRERDTVWINDGQANFKETTQDLGLRYSTDVELVDLDGDGDLDAFATKSAAANTVWLNDGHALFSKTNQSIGERGSSVALGDLDGDGDPDAFMSRLDQNEVWLNADVAADLTISNSNSQSVIRPGQSSTYVIALSNRGPDGVNDIRVLDAFHPQLTDIQWSCTASPGSICTESGTGNIDEFVSLAGGGRVTYTVQATVARDVTPGDAIVNVASFSAPAELQLISANELVATDTDIVTAVQAFTPAPNTHSAEITTDISASFAGEIDPGSVSEESLIVHGMQTGQLRQPPGALEVKGGSITLTPADPLHPGEVVQVTSTGEFKTVPASHPQRPSVWQFRTEVSQGGSGFFAQEAQRLGSSTTLDIALGDLDGDGDLDAIAANNGPRVSRDVTEPNRVWLNDGQGNLLDSGQTLGVSDSHAVALGDLDGDGDLDAVVANAGRYWLSPEPNRVWINDGHGVLHDSGRTVGAKHSRTVALGDIDGDGDLDALVGSGAGYSMRAWTNLGDGRFRGGQSYIPKSGSAEVDDVALGDLDGDGDLDAVTVESRHDFGETRIWMNVWTNDGSGRFDAGQEFESEGSSTVALGDLDGDGDLDAFIARRSIRSDAANVVWLNNGDGVFLDSGQMLGNSDSFDVQLGDVDGDGDLDAVVANATFSSDIDLPLGRAAPNRVWRNDGWGHFTDNGQQLGASFTNAIALGDLDGDGDLDILAGNARVEGDETGGNTVWLNADKPAGDLEISLSNHQGTIVPGQTIEYTLTVANNLPQDVDLAKVTTAIASQISDLRWSCIATAGSSCASQGNGNLSDRVAIQGNGSLTYTLRGTVDSAANTTIVSRASVLMPEGAVDIAPENNRAEDADTTAPIEAVPASGSHDAALAADVMLRYLRSVDPSTVSESSFTVSGSQSGLRLVSADAPLLVEGNTITFAPADDFYPGETVYVTASAAIANADGQGPVSPYVWSFRAAAGTGNQRGAGQFSDVGKDLSRDASETAVTADVDADGDLDVFVGDSLWRNDGTGRLTSNGPAVTIAADVGDLDGDGDLDLLARDGRIWLNDGRGLFQAGGNRIGNVDELPAIPGVIAADNRQALALGDLDGDGDLDVFVGRAGIYSYYSFDPFLFAGVANQVWVNDGHGKFVDSQQRIGRSFTNAVALGDLDGDGDLDAYVANGQAGLNADRVWLNDGNGIFVGGGRPIFFEGHWKDNRPATQAVALGDVDADGDLDVLLGTLEYRELPGEQQVLGEPGPAANRVLLNDGMAHFTDSGQELGMSITKGIALGDADEDGDLDAAVVNASLNSFSEFFGNATSEPDRLWINDGRGNFSPGQRLNQTDSNDVAWGDFDGDRDLDLVIASTDQRSSNLWINQNTPVAVWDGASDVGQIGDGTSWADEKNWRVDNVPDQSVVNRSDFNVVFNPAPDVGRIGLGGDRTVETIQFAADYTLEGNRLTVSGGDLHVAPDVVATLNSMVTTANGPLVKNGEGTLIMGQPSGALQVDAGTVTGPGRLESLVVGTDGTLLSGVVTGTPTVSGDAIMEGTLVVELSAAGASPLSIGGHVALLPQSKLELVALESLNALDRDRATVLVGRTIEGRFSVPPEIGDHIGFGVFVTELESTGSAVKYDADRIQVALRQHRFGDVDGDDRFSSRDVIQLIATGKYLSQQTASWTEGDWNADGVFNQRDLVAALQIGFER